MSTYEIHVRTTLTIHRSTSAFAHLSTEIHYLVERRLRDQADKCLTRASRFLEYLRIISRVNDTLLLVFEISRNISTRCHRACSTGTGGRLSSDTRAKTTVYIQHRLLSTVIIVIVEVNVNIILYITWKLGHFVVWTNGIHGTRFYTKTSMPVCVHSAVVVYITNGAIQTAKFITTSKWLNRVLAHRATGSITRRAGTSERGRVLFQRALLTP